MAVCSAWAAELHALRRGMKPAGSPCRSRGVLSSNWVAYRGAFGCRELLTASMTDDFMPSDSPPQTTSPLLLWGGSRSSDAAPWREGEHLAYLPDWDAAASGERTWKTSTSATTVRFQKKTCASSESPTLVPPSQSDSNETQPAAAQESLALDPTRRWTAERDRLQTNGTYRLHGEGGNQRRKGTLFPLSSKVRQQLSA